MLLALSFLVNVVVAYTLMSRARWWVCPCVTCTAMRRAISGVNKPRPALAAGTVVEFRKAPPASRVGGIH